MNRTSYGYIAFKIPAPEDIPDEDLVLKHSQIIKDMVKVLTDNGGELTTLNEVYKIRRIRPRPPR